MKITEIAKDDAAVKTLFDNLRNLFLSGAVGGVGLWEVKHAISEAVPVWMYIQSVIGGLIVLVSTVLFTINLMHGFNKLPKIGVVGYATLFLIYSVVAQVSYLVVMQLRAS